MSLHYYTQLDLEKEGGLDVILLSSVLITVLLVDPAAVLGHGIYERARAGNTILALMPTM